METIQATCRFCGAGVHTDLEQCDYCGNPVKVVTLKTAAELSRPILLKYVSNYESATGDDVAAPLALGILSMQLGQFSAAKERFDASIDSDPTNSEAYLYRALARLAYKKPFMCPRPVIDDVLSDLETAWQIRSLPIFKYVSALVRYDYFFRKKFKVSPTHIDEFQEALGAGVGRGDIELVLSKINCQVPTELVVE